jgi:hypothetical protein
MQHDAARKANFDRIAFISKARIKSREWGDANTDAKFLVVSCALISKQQNCS